MGGVKVMLHPVIQSGRTGQGKVTQSDRIGQGKVIQSGRIGQGRKKCPVTVSVMY